MVFDYWQSAVECLACGKRSEIADVLPAALERTHAGAAYQAMKDGEEHPIGTCPTCSAEAFSREEDMCLVCGEGRSFTACGRCEAELSLDEQDTGLCSYCQHMTDKDE